MHSTIHISNVRAILSENFGVSVSDIVCLLDGMMFFLGAAVCTVLNERAHIQRDCDSSVIPDNRLDEKWEHFEQEAAAAPPPSHKFYGRFEKINRRHC